MSREIRMLILGLVAGAVIALAVLALWDRAAEGAPGVVKEQSGEASQARAETSHADMQKTGGMADVPLQTIELNEGEQKSLGLQTTLIERRLLRSEIAAVGRIEEPETQSSVISARVGGRIDRLFVDFTGQSVRRGQAIAQIYSPEVVATAEEYRLARQNRQHLGASASSQAVAQADDLIAASHRRLELWGFNAAQIEEMARSEKPRVQVAVYAPSGGIVTERRVTEGQYVKEGDPLYVLTDLSSVWVIADVYESDLPNVRVGQTVEISAQAMSDQKLRGKISFIEPTLNPQTRTVPVRIQVANPGLRLRPGMFVTAKLYTGTGGAVIAVPRDAVLHSGTRDVVYVAHQAGTYAGREVKLGPVAGDYYPVLDGLKEGERVVTRGAFMIDSQSRITGGMSGMFGGSREFERQAASAPRASTAGIIRVDFRTDPDPARGAAENRFYVQVTGADGKAVTDAQVKVGLLMPAMPSMNMGEMRSTYDLTWNGSDYVGKGTITVAGPWTVSVEVVRNGQVIATKRARLDAR